MALKQYRWGQKISINKGHQLRQFKDLQKLQYKKVWNSEILILKNSTFTSCSLLTNATLYLFEINQSLEQFSNLLTILAYIRTVWCIFNICRSAWFQFFSNLYRRTRVHVSMYMNSCGTPWQLYINDTEKNILEKELKIKDLQASKYMDRGWQAEQNLGHPRHISFMHRSLFISDMCEFYIIVS